MTEIGNVGFKIQIPKGVKGFYAERQSGWSRLAEGQGKVTKSEKVAFSPQAPKGDWAGYNVTLIECTDGSTALEEYRRGADGKLSTCVTQELSSDGKVKVTTVRPNDVGKRGSFEMVQTLSEDGTYTCRRVGNSVEHVKQYKPSAKGKALTGFKGKLEKIFMNIAQDANGCEKPILKNISGKVIQILRRIR